MRLLFAAGLVLLAAADARAVRRTEDPLALVPADAATVGVIQLDELRQSPLGARVFRDLDHISGDGDAARFLEETGLTPREDIDTIIVAMTPGTKGSQDSGMVIFEGRFDPARIAKALESRKATLRTSPAGEYWLLKGERRRARRRGDRQPRPHRLRQRGPRWSRCSRGGESGGDGGLTSGQGIGKHLSRIDRDASAWALVDVTRFPAPAARIRAKGIRPAPCSRR